MKRIRTDILVLGSGGAGLFAALHAKRTSPNLQVTIAVKGLLGKGAEASRQARLRALVDKSLADARKNREQAQKDAEAASSGDDLVRIGRASCRERV